MILLKINSDNTITYPYSTYQLMNDYPNTSFPERITVDVFSEYSVHVVNTVNIQFDFTKNYTEGLPTLIDGLYYQNWIITDATQDEINQRLCNQWIQIRNQRNIYLQESDWTQLSDSPLSNSKKIEWSIYRQELRDVTLQQDPFNIMWPTKPE
jgi:hypothetical protein